MNKEQCEFADLIFKMNSENIAIALSKGAKINKGNTKKNTINYAVRVLLSHPVDRFNIKFIEVLLEHGCKICDVGTNNTLGVIIRRIKRYIDKAKINNDVIMAERNIEELLNILLSKGARADNYNILSDIVDQQNMELEIVNMLCNHKVLPIVSHFTEYDTLRCAIRTNNLGIVKIICENKGSPNISQTWKNTLNHAIKKNNPEMVRMLRKFNALPNVSQDESNTLTCAVNSNNVKIVKIIRSIKGYPDASQTKSNTLNCAVRTNNPEIVRIVCESNESTKCIANVTQTENNTLSCAVNTKNLEIVKILCEYEKLRLPDVSGNGSNTLNCAVKTNNLEIVKMIFEIGGLPVIGQTLDNTLTQAVQIKNPGIIHEIIMRGGKPNNYNYHNYNFNNYYGYQVINTFDTFYNIMHKCDDIEEFDQLINLLMCSGVKMNYYVLEKLNSEPNSYYKKKIINCYNLLQRKRLEKKEEIQKKKELKNELTKTMKQLMEGSVPKTIIMEQIDDATQCYIPIPCVDMIYEYQHTKSSVQEIDWSEY